MSMFKGPGYGLAEMGINGVEVFLRLHLLVFYVQKIGMSPQLAGLAIGLSIFTDAFFDPFLGWWSDRFQAQTQKRYWMIPIGGGLLAAALVLVFNPLLLSSAWGQFVSLLGMMILLNAFYTLLSVPYAAAVGDMTTDEQVRGKLIGWRLAFANLGAIMGIGVPGYFLVNSEASAYFSSAGVISLVVVTTSIISGCVVWSSKSQTPNPPSSQADFSWQEVLSPLREGLYRWLLIGYFIANIGLTFNSSYALFYYRDKLKFSETQIQWVLLSFLIVFTLSIPLWLFLSRRLGSLNSLVGGVFVLGVSTCFIYPSLPQGDLMMALLLASGVGGVLVGSSVLLETLLTELAEDRARQTGKSAMGLYFGLWKMSGKISRGVALAMTGSVLAWAQLDPTGSRLGIAFGPLVGLFFMMASLLLIWGLRGKIRGGGRS